MINIDKILKRSLSSDIVAMRKRFECCVEMEDEPGVYLFLSKKELKKLTVKDHLGMDYLNIPNDKLQNLYQEYRKLNSKQKLLDSLVVEDLTLDQNISDESIYTVIWNESLESVSYKVLKKRTKTYAKPMNVDAIKSYGEEFFNLFTKKQIKQITKGKIALFLSPNGVLLVSA